MDFKYPNIRIQRGLLLEEPVRLMGLTSRNQKNSPVDLAKRISEYRAIWPEYENKILKGICGILNLEFLQNIIDVYIVSHWTSAMSSPLIIPSGYSPELFPHVLTHELIHRLLGDNNRRVKTLKIQESLFPSDFTQRTKNHIIVHSVHKVIFLEILNRPDLLEREILEHQNSPDYKNSWDYVEKTGHLKIIQKFKNLAGLNG